MMRPGLPNLTVNYTPCSDLLSKLEKSEIESILIEIHNENLELAVSTRNPIRRNEFENSTNFFEWKYFKKDQGTLVVLKNGEKEKIEDQSFMELFCLDFQKITREGFENLKFYFEDLSKELKNLEVEDSEVKLLEDSEFLTIFEASLKYRKTPMKVKNFVCNIKNQDQILPILPYLDPQALEKIGFFCSYSMKQSPGKLEIEKIVELEQWKKAKVFETNFEISTKNLKNFGHFLEGHLKIENIEEEDLILLKNTFLPNPGFRHFLLEFGNDFDSRQFLQNAFGPPENEENPVWMFKDPTRDVLGIRLFAENMISFQK